MPPLSQAGRTSVPQLWLLHNDVLALDPTESTQGWAWRRRCQGAGRRRAWWSGGLLRQRGGAEPYSPPTSRAQIIVERGTDLGPPVRSVLDLHPRRLVRRVRRRAAASARAMALVAKVERKFVKPRS